MKRLIQFIVILNIFWLQLAAHADISNNIPTNDRSYALIDKLAASGLTKTPITAQKPWTRDYAAKLVKEAMENRDKLLIELEKPETKDYKEYNKLLAQKRFVDAILNDLSVTSTRNFHPLSSVSFTYTYLNNAPKTITSTPPNNINAQFYPLPANQQGRQYNEGSNYYIETESSLTFPKYFSAYLRPQFMFIYPSTSAPEKANAYIHNLYAKTGINSFEVEIGRDELIWGNSLHGEMMFSDNPRPLDMVKLSTSAPVNLLFPVRATLIAANLGPSYDPEDAWIYGGKINISPISWLDIGFSDIGQSRSGYSTKNKIGFDGKLTFAGFRGASLYGEGYIEDAGNDNYGWLGGLYFPRFDFIGKWSLRVEYKRSGANAYTSTEYPSGWALNGFLIGDQMGPDAQEFLVDIDYNFTPKTKLGISGGYAKRYSANNESHVFNIYSLDIPLKGDRLNFYSSVGWDYENNKADLMIQAGLKINFPEL